MATLNQTPTVREMPTLNEELGRTPTLYELLGVAHNADAPAIERAFRTEAFKYHPDRNPGNEQAIQRFKDLNNAKDILLDPEKRAEYDHQLAEGRSNATPNATHEATCDATRNYIDEYPDYDSDYYTDDDTESSHEYYSENDDEGFDSRYETGEPNDEDWKVEFSEKYYSTTPRNYRTEYSSDPTLDNYDEHRHYIEEYTPKVDQRKPDDDDPDDETERAHCHYEPYTPLPDGLKRCQGCKLYIRPTDTECRRAKHIIEPSRYYITKCCKYTYHADCYRRALFDHLDIEGRFRCEVCHNYAEGDVVYHAFDLEIFPDVNYTTSPSPWRVADDEVEDLNDPTCRCFTVPGCPYDEEFQCRCFTGACFACNPVDHIRWWFHLLKKRIISHQDYWMFVWRMEFKGEIDADKNPLIDKIRKGPLPPPKLFRPNPVRAEERVGEGEADEAGLVEGVGQMAIERIGRSRQNQTGTPDSSTQRQVASESRAGHGQQQPIQPAALSGSRHTSLVRSRSNPETSNITRVSTREG